MTEDKKYMPIIETLLTTYGANVLIGLFVMASLATSGYAGAKIYTSVVAHPTIVPVQIQTSVPSVIEEVTPTQTDQIPESPRSEKVNAIVVNQEHNTTARNTILPTAKSTSRIVPTVAPAKIVTAPSASTNASLCIVTISGQQFDVTRLRSTHSGGDIFACGTDMTATYQSRHGTSLSRMSAYAVNAQTGATAIGSTGASGAIVTTKTSTFHEEEHEDERTESHFTESEKKKTEDHPEEKSEEHEEDEI